MEAIEPMYLQALCNSVTNSLTSTIPDIFTWIINTYGQLSETHMLSCKQNLTAFTYDTTQPVNIVFNEIDRYCDLADLTGLPISDRCKCQLKNQVHSLIA